MAVNFPTRLQSGGWVDMQPSEVSITSQTGGTVSFEDGVYNAMQGVAIIRIGVTPSSVTQKSSLANIKMGEVDALVTIRGQTPSKTIGNGSSSSAIAISTLISSTSKIRTRTLGIEASSSISSTVIVYL